MADVHLGNHRRFGGPVECGLNQRCRATLDVFQRAAERAVTNDASAFVVLGDLFDTDRPEPQLLTAVQGVLVYLKQHGVRVVLLAGNHDQRSGAPGDHALGPLAPYAEVVDAPRVLRAGAIELGCVPFRTGDAPEWLASAIRGLRWYTGSGLLGDPGLPSADRVLCVHAGVRDVHTAPWLQQAQDAVDVGLLVQLARECSARKVLAGNWHDRQAWVDGDVEVMQLGALVPTGQDNPGFDGYGTLAVLHQSGELTYEELAGPRFIKVQSERELESALTRAAAWEGTRLYVRWEVRASGYRSAADRVEDLVRRGAVVGGEVVLDPGEAQERASAAAQAARGAGGLQAALEAYVAECALSDGVDRAAVLSRCREYLK